MREYDQAIEDYNQDLRLKPRDALAFYNRSAAELQKGELQKSIADLSEAARFATSDYERLLSRGLLYAR